jgi:hypothetical protein
MQDSSGHSVIVINKISIYMPMYTVSTLEDRYE